MKPIELFSALSINPTSDMKEIKTAYRDKYKRLNKQIASKRREGEDFSKEEEQLLHLNMAYNELTKSESNLQTLENIASKTNPNKSKKKAGIETYDDLISSVIGKARMESESKSDTLSSDDIFIEKLKNRIEIKFKSQEIPLEYEEVTMGTYLRGGTMMLEVGKENVIVEIPKGFQGIFTESISNRLHFIRIAVKTSPTFSMLRNGDLELLALPKKTEFIDNGMRFTFSGKTFELSSKNGAYDKDCYVFATDVNKYGTNNPIQIVIPESSPIFSDIYENLGKI